MVDAPSAACTSTQLTSLVRSSQPYHGHAFSTNLKSHRARQRQQHSKAIQEVRFGGLVSLQIRARGLGVNGILGFSAVSAYGLDSQLEGEGEDEDGEDGSLGDARRNVDNKGLDSTAIFMDPEDILFALVVYFKSLPRPALREQIDISNVKDSLQRDPAILDPRRRAMACVEKQTASKTSDTPAKLRSASRLKASLLSERSNATRPDTYLLLVDKKSIDAQRGKKNQAKGSLSDSWDDIVVSFEFKKSAVEAECKDYDKRVIRSLHHIIRSDRCRRATFGIATKNTQMKFWFTCRVATLVSKLFDFFMEPEHLIHFSCRVAFAPPRAWMGAHHAECASGVKSSTTLTCTQMRGKTWYTRPRVISDFSASALRGHGTRDFETRLKSQDGKSVKDAELVVLKDSWRDCDRHRQDKILEQVFVDLRKKQRDQARGRG
ncbi:hypothetical protein F5141DRAFT_1224090 [Pisolithus sp. B1]|nr:hypothetical protein F5141DRAFT_1224090 [Pisolithus sp. B1]